MPKKDGTGPTGSGPMTGFAGGRCAVPLNTKKEELDFLKKRAEVLKGELESVRSRLAALETPRPARKKS